MIRPKAVYKVTLKKVAYIEVEVVASDEEEAVVKALEKQYDNALIIDTDTEVEYIEFDEHGTAALEGMYYDQKYQERKEDC